MKSSEAKRPAWVAETLNAATSDKLRPVVGFLIGVTAITLAVVSMAAAAPVTCDMRGCSDWKTTSTVSKPSRHPRRQPVDANGNAVVSGRPSQCYVRIRGRLIAYCGCAVSLRVFGKPVRDLFLAANWYRKFPRTSAAPGMVAARSGHVMVLLSHVNGSEWLVYDPNSGGGLTREHVRSINGFRIVNPHGSYAER